MQRPRGTTGPAMFSEKLRYVKCKNKIPEPSPLCKGQGWVSVEAETLLGHAGFSRGLVPTHRLAGVTLGRSCQELLEQQFLGE